MKYLRKEEIIALEDASDDEWIEKVAFPIARGVVNTFASDVEERDDLVSIAVILLWQKRRSVDVHNEKAFGYMTAIAKNAMRNEQRKLNALQVGNARYMEYVNEEREREGRRKSKSCCVDVVDDAVYTREKNDGGWPPVLSENLFEAAHFLPHREEEKRIREGKLLDSETLVNDRNRRGQTQ